MTAPTTTQFAALAKRQGELIRKPLAGIIAVADIEYEVDDPFYLTATTSAALVELATEWSQLGWVSKSDGLTFDSDTTTSDVESWGALEPTRSDITSDTSSGQFVCQETNKKVLEMYYNVDLSSLTPAPSTGEIAFNQSTEPETTYRRTLFLSKDGAGTREIYIGKLMPRASVTTKAGQNWNTDDALTYGMTMGAKVDDDLGYSVRHLFAGPGWKSKLEAMGFPAATP